MMAPQLMGSAHLDPHRTQLRDRRVTALHRAMIVERLESWGDQETGAQGA